MCIRDSFYLEIQDHGIPEQREVNRGIFRLSEELDIPLVATNDAHYITREDAYIQDVLMCIQMNKTVDDPDRMKFASNEFYIKSEEEMASLFPNYPEAIENTGKIAARCQVEFDFGTHHLPQFDLPENFPGTARDYLQKITREGFTRRYPDEPPAYLERLKDVYKRQVSDIGTLASRGFPRLCDYHGFNCRFSRRR